MSGYANASSATSSRLRTTSEMRRALVGWLRSEEGIREDQGEEGEIRRVWGEAPEHRWRSVWVASLAEASDFYLEQNAVPALIAELERMGWKVLEHDQGKFAAVVLAVAEDEAERRKPVSLSEYKQSRRGAA